MELSPRNERAVADLLKQVAYEGRADIAKWRIAETYGQDTFSVSVRRDLRNRWDAFLDDLEWDKSRPSLRIADVNGQIVLMRSSDFHPDKE